MVIVSLKRTHKAIGMKGRILKIKQIRQDTCGYGFSDVLTASGQDGHQKKNKCQDWIIKYQSFLRLYWTL
jgi:hypothetical protein